MDFDPRNYLSIMVHICDTFDLSHADMMRLRERVEKTFRAQPEAFSKRTPTPVSLNAVAISYGLMIGFGGYAAALEVSGERVVKVARGYDPFDDLDPALQKQMYKQANARRREQRRWGRR